MNPHGARKYGHKTGRVMTQIREGFLATLDMLSTYCLMFYDLDCCFYFTILTVCEVKADKRLLRVAQASSQPQDVNSEK